MAAIDTVTGYATAPSTTQTNLTMASGDSLTIKNAPAGAFLTNLWAKNQAAGILRVGSGRMHNITDALRFRVIAAEVYPLLPLAYAQPLFAQDTLTADISGSPTAGDLEIAVIQFYYPSLPGSDARLVDAGSLRSRIVNFLALEVAITAGTTGGWSGAAALNASFTRMKANVDYALLGIMTSTLQAAVAVRGTDTGGLRVAVPGHANNKMVNRSWFVDNAVAMGVPFIPIINGANQGSTFVEVANDENAASPNITLVLAQLR